MKLLLHTCCAPCSIQCAEELDREGIKPELFWYNPNIHPFTEYRSRKTALESFAKDRNLSLISEDEYGLRSFILNVAGAEYRCVYCYRLRLEKTARVASEKGYEAFSTTLLISPYQNHELIKQIAEELAATCGIAFLYRDFRPRFRQGQNQAKAAGYYMQKYCGCIFSEEERYLGSKQ